MRDTPVTSPVYLQVGQDEYVLESDIQDYDGTPDSAVTLSHDDLDNMYGEDGWTCLSMREIIQREDATSDADWERRLDESRGQ